MKRRKRRRRGSAPKSSVATSDLADLYEEKQVSLSTGDVCTLHPPTGSAHGLHSRATLSVGRSISLLLC